MRKLMIAMALVSSAFGYAAQHSVMTTQVEDNNIFAFELYEQLKSKEGNLFFSPYSLSSALAMTSLGAAGETKEEMDTGPSLE